MDLGSLTRPELIFADVPGADGPTALRSLAEKLAGAGVVSDADDLYQRLTEREKLGTTALGSGVAVPHCKLDDLDEVAVAIGICRKGIDFGAPDGEPVRLLCVVLSPSQAPAEHLQSLAAISKWVKADRHVERILKLDDPQRIYALLQEESE